MKRILIGVVAGLLVTAPVAGAVASHTFGHPGKAVKLDPRCHRTVVARPGITLQRQIDITQAQVKCLIRLRDASGGGGGGPGVPGPQGPAGPQGERGPAGPKGEPGDSVAVECFSQAGEVPRSSGIELRNYLDKIQDCIAPESDEQE